MPFSGLTPEIISKVVDKFIAELEFQLADRGVDITVSQAARSHLAETGFDPAFGARPLARVIAERVKKPLADDLLFGKLTRGGSVHVDFKDGQLVFEVEAAKRPPAAEEDEGDAAERTPELTH